MFEQLGVYPNEIILLDGDFSKIDELQYEDNKYKYSDIFFNIRPLDSVNGFSVNSFLDKCQAKIIKVPTSNINSEYIAKEINKLSNSHFIFTGGGIVKKEIVGQKKLIHVHPGIVPEYRGSTCFYYSILKENTIGATAIIMDEGIDTGNVIISTEFKINYLVNQDQPLFVDYILDSYIRAYTLKKVIEQYIVNGILEVSQQEISDRPAYYVMHPFLRYLAINKINSSCNKNAPFGIFEVN